MIQAHTATYGRRAVSYEFIDNDTPGVRDLGRRQRAFNLTVFVIEPNYFEKREDLVSVSERHGEQLLVHPYLGELNVHITSLSVTETDTEGGIARVQLECVEAETQTAAIFLTLDTDAVAAADFTLARSRDDLTARLGAVSAFRSGFTGAILRATSALNKVKGKITTSLGVIDDLDDAIERFDAAVSSIINTPSELATKLIGLYASVLALAGKPQAAETARTQPGALLSSLNVVKARQDALLSALATLTAVDTAAPATAFDTPRRAAQRAQHAELTSLLQIAAAASAAKEAVGLEYGAASDAIAARDAIVAALSALDGTTDAAFESLRTLEGVLTAQFDVVIARLDQVEAVTLQHSKPALVLAYERYRDAERDAEIVGRNRTAARNPLAIAADTELELLRAD